MTSENENLTNPAARLLELLNKAKHHGGGTAAQAFGKMFDIDANDTEELYRRLSTCAQTTHQLAEIVGSITNDKFKKSFQTTVVSVAQFFTPRHIDQNWDEYKKKILDKDTHALQLCSDLLGQGFQEQLIDKDSLTDLFQKVDSLYAEVRDSDLDQNLKRTILDGLQAIRTAIHEYTVRGAAGLQEALATALGQYMIFNVYVNAQMQHGSTDGKEPATDGSGKTPDSKVEFAKKYLTLVVLLGNVVGMAYHAAPKLAEIIQHLLPPSK